MLTFLLKHLVLLCYFIYFFIQELLHSQPSNNPINLFFYILQCKTKKELSPLFQIGIKIEPPPSQQPLVAFIYNEIFIMRHKASTRLFGEEEREWSCFPEGPKLATITDPFTQYNKIHPFSTNALDSP